MPNHNFSFSEEHPLIEIKNLSKVFRTKNTEVKALNEIELSIQKGDIYGIIGMSGAGKSTLVRCMNFLEKPTSGTVLFDGKDLSKLSPRGLREARQEIGMIFQQFNLLMQRTAQSNICFPLEIAGVSKEKATERALELLDLVGLKEKAQAYPSQLSGGQKQRVAIARALATNPKVLLCDEATSALDPNTTRSILALLKDINQKLGITIVIITHEMAVIEEICSHVAIIDESRIAEAGRVEEIFSHPKSASARRLVYPKSTEEKEGSIISALRIVFDGTSPLEPVITNMVLEYNAPVNILFADIKNIEGKAVGHLIIEAPSERETALRLKQYLQSKKLTVEEVMHHVG